MQEQLSKRVSDLEAQNKTLREALDEKDELINNLLVRPSLSLKSLPCIYPSGMLIKHNIYL
jgi:cell shape-determining protein MreC